MAIAQATVVLHPAAEDVVEKLKLAPRLTELKDKTIGLIDNYKKNADVYLSEVGRLLQMTYGVARLVTYRKDSQSIPTPDEILDQLALECDAIIHGVAD